MATQQPTPILDDLAGMQSLDKRNMLRLINELPEQCETALGIGRSLSIDPLLDRPNVVFISGTGEGGIAADMAAAILGEEIAVGVVSDHGGRLPAYVGEDSLVFLVDYSGKNQSTLRNYREAKLRGANVICIAGRGKLLESASQDGGKIVRIPTGQPPRTAIGYLFVPLVALIERYDLASGLIENISYAIKLMKNVREMFRSENLTARNLAKQTALDMYQKLPVIYAANGYRAAVASHWRVQISANSKTPVLSGTFPEVAESEISGWEPEGKQLDDATFVFLKDPLDKMTEIPALMSSAKEVLERFGVREIEMKGATTAEKMLYGIYLGDYVSYYLAMLYGVNPTPTEYVSLAQSEPVQQQA